jgi:hypothetical protein
MKAYISSIFTQTMHLFNWIKLDVEDEWNKVTTLISFLFVHPMHPTPPHTHTHTHTPGLIPQAAYILFYLDLRQLLQPLMAILQS